MHRKRRQQGHAHPGGNHLPQGFQAGGAEPGPLLRTGQTAHVQRLLAQAMSVFQQEQGFVGKFRHRKRGPRCQCMLPWRGQHERLIEQPLGMQLIVVQRQCQQGRIQLALTQARQQHVALFLDQQQFQLRKALAQLRHHVRQQVRAKGGEHAKPQRACLRVPAATRGFLHLLDFGHDAACAQHHVLAGCSQHELARRTLHQHHPQLFLELPDLGGQRRLADETRLRRLAEMAQLGQGNQVTQVAQVHAAGALGANALRSNGRTIASERCSLRPLWFGQAQSPVLFGDTIQS